MYRKSTNFIFFYDILCFGCARLNDLNMELFNIEKKETLKNSSSSFFFNRIYNLKLGYSPHIDIDFFLYKNFKRVIITLYICHCIKGG